MGRRSEVSGWRRGVAVLVLAACGPTAGHDDDTAGDTATSVACPIPRALLETPVSFVGDSTAPIVGMIAIDVEATPGVELLVVRGNEVQMVIAAQAAPVVTAAKTLLGAVAGDIDGDGDFDLLTSEDDGGAVLRIWWRDGGVFVDSAVTRPLGEGTAFALTDHDADHDLDVLVRDGSTLVVVPFEGVGFGTPIVAVGGPIDSWTIFDAEPDGLADLLYASGSTITLEPRKEVGEPTTLVLSGVDGVRGFTIGDFTADGILDAFMIGQDAATWSTLVGPLLTEPPITRSPTTPGFQRAGVGDLDGDGHSDLVLAGAVTELFVRYGWSPGDSETEPFHCDAPLPISIAADRAALVDIDGDGENELVISDGTDVVLLDD